MHKLRNFMRGAIVAGVLLLLVQAAFQSLPLFLPSDANAINNAGLQRTRSQVLVKSAFTLAYRPKQEHAQAVSDIQTVLPLWQQEQEALTQTVSIDVQPLLTDARGDYLAMLAASKVILAHSDSVNLIQVDIMAASNRNYVRAMNQVVILLVRQADVRVRSFWFFELLIDLLIFSIAIAVFFRVEQAWKDERESQGDIASLNAQVQHLRQAVWEQKVASDAQEVEKGQGPVLQEGPEESKDEDR